MAFRNYCLLLVLIGYHSSSIPVAGQSINGTSAMTRDKYAMSMRALNDSLPLKLAAKVSDDLLLRCLMARKGSVADAKTLLHNYESVRSRNAGLFTVSKLNLFLKVQQAVGLVNGTKTREGEYVFYHNVGSWDPSTTSLAEDDSCILVMHEIISLDPEINEKGYVVIIDAKDISTKHVRKISPRLQSEFLGALIESLPVHITKIYVINTNWAANILFNLIKSTLPTRLTQILTFASEEDLKLVFGEAAVRSKAYLPSEADRIRMAERLISSLDPLLDTRARVML